MGKGIESSVGAISAVWPHAVPAEDYGRMLRLIQSLVVAPAPAPAPEVGGQVVVVPARKRKKRTGTKVGAGTLGRMRDLLATGPASARDIGSAMGLSEYAVHAALRQIGAVEAGKTTRVDGRSGRQPSLYALPSGAAQKEAV